MIKTNGMYKFKSFPKTIIQGVSTSYYGSIKDSKGLHVENLNRFAHAIGVDPQAIILPSQAHTSTIQEVSFIEKNLSHTDAIITKTKKLVLGVVTADCLPLIFYDTKEKIVAVVHAGYKGILAGIIENTIKRFKLLGSNPKNILTGIGPGIHVCCYNVTLERINLFSIAFPSFKNVYEKRNGDYYLHMRSVAIQILKTYGILKKNIEEANMCTKCNSDIFYSKRASQTFCKEFATVIAMT
jgi:YfiH family protein